MDIGKYVKNYRDTHDLTMQEFAQRAGLSKGYISMLERGRHPQNNRPIIPSITTVQKLARVMNMSVDNLLSVVDSDQLISLNPIDEPSSSVSDLSGVSSSLTGNAAADPLDEQLLNIFHKLNDIGKRKAIDNVGDLAGNDKYTNQSDSEQINT